MARTKKGSENVEGKQISERRKRMDAAMKEINAKFKSKVIKYPTEALSYKKRHFGTGSVLLDLAIGYSPENQQWGWPERSVVEIIGAKGTGKTNLCLNAARDFTNRGGLVCYIDSEHALDETRLKAFGLYDNENFVIVNPETGHQSWDLLHTIMKLGIYELIIFDSLATVSSKAEDELETMEKDPIMGGASKLNNLAVRKIHSIFCQLANKFDNGEDISIPTIIITNQQRKKMDLFGGTTSPGGEGRKYLDLLTVELTELIGKDNIYRREYSIYDDEGKQTSLTKVQSDMLDLGETYGITVKFEVVKNKVGLPYGKGRYVILLGDLLNHKKFDIFTEKEILLAFLKKGVITIGARGWYQYKGENYREAQLLAAFSQDLDYFKQVLYLLYAGEDAPEDILKFIDKEKLEKDAEQFNIDSKNVIINPLEAALQEDLDLLERSESDGV